MQITFLKVLCFSHFCKFQDFAIFRLRLSGNYIATKLLNWLAYKNTLDAPHL